VSDPAPPAEQGSARTVDVVVIGAGHSGLAMSHCLSERSIEHVVLERGDVANSWRHERWDSLRLLTPNWQTRLPGYGYTGDNPDGFMSMAEVVDFIAGYADRIGAPVVTNAAVNAVTQVPQGYRVASDAGQWTCRAIVLASGGFNTPLVPKLANELPAAVATYTTQEYRNPQQIDAGGVLVVGASATGLQLAHEIHTSGRPVTLAVGEHIRLPRVYRGLDIQWWMDAVGILDERWDEVDDIIRARRIPSPQLVGTDERATLDINVLTDLGVRIVGRFVGLNGVRAQFSGSLRNHCKMADLKLNRLLGEIDDWAQQSGKSSEVEPPERYDPTRVEDSPPLELDLRKEDIRSVVWATGFRPDYSWLKLPVLDHKGLIRHDGGVADAPGVYVLGLTFLRRRKSSFIHGAEDDARDLTAHLAAHLDRAAARSPVQTVS
jgi:putative flavoprotein involved in K+ transport